MKQHITIDQLKELSEEQQEKLRLWYLTHQCEGTILVNLKELQSPNSKIDPVRFVERNAPLREEYEPFWVPLLSIGQLMEFLGEKKQFTSDWEHGENTTRELVVLAKFTFVIPQKYMQEGMEICDFLWSCAKYILEKTD